jgi:hypothetical protein
MAVAAYGALRLWRRQPMPTADCYAAIEMTKEGTWSLLNLAIINNSPQKVWADEYKLSLSELNGRPSKDCEPKCRGVLRIREFVRPGETLRIDLGRTIYEAAGLPQADYRFIFQVH